MICSQPVYNLVVFEAKPDLLKSSLALPGDSASDK
jgi:hypothetical protein